MGEEGGVNIVTKEDEDEKDRTEGGGKRNRMKYFF
jgi:hypothetical protein